MNKPNLVLAFYPQRRGVDFRGRIRNKLTTMRTLRDDANNDTAFGLIAAAHNWRELRQDWCECPPADELMEVFFRDPKTGADDLQQCIQNAKDEYQSCVEECTG